MINHHRHLKIETDADACSAPQVYCEVIDTYHAEACSVKEQFVVMSAICALSQIAKVTRPQYII